MIRVLYIGDVVGQPGRRALHQKLETVIDREMVDFTIVNIENAAGGFGVTEAIMEELSELPINAYTSGNHIWDKKDFVDNYEHYPHVIRPANYPAGNPGKGKVIRQTAGGVNVAVLQFMGNVFMPPIDNPFYCADRELAELGDAAKVIIVDIHGEATSEKQAFGRYLDGRVSAVLGTHTHVPTADERILPNGTAYQTDVGMTGAYDSVIGFRPDEALHRFLMNTPRKLEVAKRDIRLSGVLVEVDESDGRRSRSRGSSRDLSEGPRASELDAMRLSHHHPRPCPRRGSRAADDALRAHRAARARHPAARCAVAASRGAQSRHRCGVGGLDARRARARDDRRRAGEGDRARDDGGEGARVPHPQRAVLRGQAAAARRATTGEVRLFHRRHYMRYANKGEWDEITVQGSVVRLDECAALGDVRVARKSIARISPRRRRRTRWLRRVLLFLALRARHARARREHAALSLDRGRIRIADGAQPPAS